MSREIKFRAWDKENEEYRDGYGILLKYDGSAISRYALEALSTDIPNNVIIEQYTGLKDRHGTEIYEGDIVKVTKWVDDEKLGHEELVHIAKIFWLDRYAQFGTDYSDNLSDEITEDFYEVIGNIHENPELLGGEE